MLFHSVYWNFCWSSQCLEVNSETWLPPSVATACCSAPLGCTVLWVLSKADLLQSFISLNCLHSNAGLLEICILYLKWDVFTGVRLLCHFHAWRLSTWAPKWGKNGKAAGRFWVAASSGNCMPIVCRHVVIGTQTLPLTARCGSK